MVGSVFRRWEHIFASKEEDVVVQIIPARAGRIQIAPRGWLNTDKKDIGKMNC